MYIKNLLDFLLRLFSFNDKKTENEKKLIRYFCSIFENVKWSESCKMDFVYFAVLCESFSQTLQYFVSLSPRLCHRINLLHSQSISFVKVYLRTCFLNVASERLCQRICWRQRLFCRHNNRKRRWQEREFILLHFILVFSCSSQMENVKKDRMIKGFAC